MTVEELQDLIKTVEKKLLNENKELKDQILDLQDRVVVLEEVEERVAYQRYQSSQFDEY